MLDDSWYNCSDYFGDKEEKLEDNEGKVGCIGIVKNRIII